MIDRRKVLQSGVVVSAAAVSPSVLLASASAEQPGRSPLRPARFVVDTRFRESIVTGQAAQAAGLNVVEVDGDLSRLWYDDLDLAWRQAPMVLAGVTGPDGLFVLETLANDRGMRLVFRGDHGRLANGTERHSMHGTPDALRACMSGFGRSVSPWGAPMCAALTGLSAGRQTMSRIELGTPSIAAARETGTLVSWVIAPRGVATPILRA